MSTARFIFDQQNGEVTKAFYAELAARGPLGEVAVCLFRAQKRSSRAKEYRPGKFRRAAYDVKEWSLAELCRRLQSSGAELGFAWGWKEDPATLFGARASWVLYVDLPAERGQVSFHSPSRGEGPAYAGEWDGVRGVSVDRILAFCDELLGRGPDPLLESRVIPTHAGEGPAAFGATVAQIPEPPEQMGLFSGSMR